MDSETLHSTKSDIKQTAQKFQVGGGEFLAAAFHFPDNQIYVYSCVLCYYTELSSLPVYECILMYPPLKPDTRPADRMLSEACLSQGLRTWPKCGRE